MTQLRTWAAGTLILTFISLTAPTTTAGAASACPALPSDTLTAFRLPAIPATLRTPAERADYLVRHYWDYTQWTDTNYIHHPEITEQAWANYIQLLHMVPRTIADDALWSVFASASVEPRCFRYLAVLAEKYLYALKSPLYDEEQYLTVLNILLASPLLSEAEKLTPTYRRRQALKNRVGSIATNLHFTLYNKEAATLHALRAPHLLLFFNDPECHRCCLTREALESSPTVNAAISRGELLVVSLYVGDDSTLWRERSANYPSTWVNACDLMGEVSLRQLYEIRSMPTLYLLDADKRVLLKNASVEGVESHFKRQ